LHGLSQVLGFTPLVPVAAATLILLIYVLKLRDRTLYNLVLLVGSSLTAASTLVVLSETIYGGFAWYCFGGWGAPLGICYYADELSAYYAAVTSAVFTAVAVYAVWYSRHVKHTALLYVLLLLHLSGLLAVYYTVDLFNLFVSLELVGITGYSLVSFYHYRAKALVAAARYAVAGGLMTIFLLLGVLLIYTATGAVNIGVLGAKLSVAWSPPDQMGFFNKNLYADTSLVIIAIAMILWTALFISAIFPNHFWLPDAHSEAPVPVSAVLSGLTTAMGFYVLARIAYTVLAESVLAGFLSTLLPVIGFLGIVSVFYGAIMIGVEDDVKRILAYSTILNNGYILMGLSQGTALGIAASLYHILNHAVGKALAFLCIGYMVRRYRTRNIYALEGAGRAQPIVGSVLAFALLHLIGVPPTSGFFGKFYLFKAFIDADNLAYALVVIAGSVISAYGYIRVMEHTVYVSKPEIVGKEHLSIIVTITLTTLSTVILLLGIANQWVIDYLTYTASTLVLDSTVYIERIYGLCQSLLSTISYP